MLLLVVADNTLQLLVGWELVGLCSFMLIGHWWEEKPNSDAALKAFLTTRTGDIGLMIGVIVTFFAAGQTLQTSSGSTRPRSTVKGGHTIWLVGASLPAHRDHRQDRPVPAPHLAARRHGRPDAGVGAHPRRDDGRRRRLPRRPPLPGVLRRASRSATAASTSMALIGGDHDPHRRRARVRAGRHQEGARVLHDQPARLHGDGARRRRVDRARCSTSSPTRSSRRPLPRRRLGEPLGLAPLLRHEEGHGRPAQVHAASRSGRS